MAERYCLHFKVAPSALSLSAQGGHMGSCHWWSMRDMVRSLASVLARVVDASTSVCKKSSASCCSCLEVGEAPEPCFITYVTCSRPSTSVYTLAWPIHNGAGPAREETV